MKKSNVSSMYKHADNNGFFKSEHCTDVVRFKDTNPHVYVIQLHLKNLKATYSDKDIMEAIELLGIDKDMKKAG